MNYDARCRSGYEEWYLQRWTFNKGDIEAPNLFEAWQAATTVLLEKLKSEEMIKIISATIVATDGDYSDEARAIIKALVKELVG